MAALPAALKYRRPPGYRRFHALKPQLAKIERVYKRIDHTERDCPRRPTRQGIPAVKSHCPRSDPSMKRFIMPPLQTTRRIVSDSAFSRSLGQEFAFKFVEPMFAKDRIAEMASKARAPQ